MDHVYLKQAIATLSEDVRLQLRHQFRNGLQTISSSIETGDPQLAMDYVAQFVEDLRRFGL